MSAKSTAAAVSVVSEAPARSEKPRVRDGENGSARSCLTVEARPLVHGRRPMAEGCYRMPLGWRPDRSRTTDFAILPRP